MSKCLVKSLFTRMGHFEIGVHIPPGLYHRKDLKCTQAVVATFLVCAYIR